MTKLPQLVCLISRPAKLACVTDQLQSARMIAKDRILFAGDVHAFIRCFGFYHARSVFAHGFGQNGIKG